MGPTGHGSRGRRPGFRFRVVDRLITNMADVVRAMAEPLSKVDKITIVSTGGDGQIGANKITGEMTKIAAQVKNATGRELTLTGDL